MRTTINPALRSPGILLLLVVVFCNNAIRAQLNTGQTLLPGYHHAIAGEVIPYFSVYRQYAKEALLTRCTDGKKIIEWETDTIPSSLQGEYAYFTWIAAHSSGTSSGERFFDLYINDQKTLTFSTRAKEYPERWRFVAADSTALEFEFKTRDGANDSHGMAYLRVPLKQYKKENPLRLKVVGQAQQSNDWYMTFKYVFTEKVEVKDMPFVLKNGIEQVLQVTALHFGSPATLQLNLGNALIQEFPVVNGFNRFEVPIPIAEDSTSIAVKAIINNQVLLNEFIPVKPVKFRELNLVHHSHTDIGYSHLQEEVIQIHNHNIREALRLINKTKDYPIGSRFIWHIESAWVVENFLRECSTPEKESFIRAVKNRQILISANYANIMTGLCLPEELDWITDYALHLRKEYSLPIQTAMLTDVPGMSWSVVSSLAKRGIRYFSNGINYIEGMPGGGDRIGQALTAHGDRPFWWLSPSGKDSILMWCAGKGYSSWHGTAQGAVKELGPEKIAAYLRELDEKNYPFDIVQWRYNIVADNGPADSTISDFVKNWNEQYASPKLILANATELFERFETKYGRSIPSYSGDFTPYWEDGAYSTAKEEADNRLAAQRILQLEKLADQYKLKADPELSRLAKKFVVLFHEHTWGAHNSISEPDLPFVTRQWAYKKSYLDSAIYFTKQLEESLLRSFEPNNKIRVINTTGYQRSAYVEMETSPSFTGNMITDESGKEIPVQRIGNNRLGFIATGIPARGEKKYQLKLSKTNQLPALLFPLQINNRNKAGNIESIKTGSIEWVAAQSNFRSMLQPVYINGTNPNKFDTAQLLRSEWTISGPVVRTVRLTYAMKGVRSLTVEFSQYNGLDYAKATVTIDKLPVRTKESLHLSLPFLVPVAATRIGVGDGITGPDFRQLTGANKDYFSVQRWINVGNSNKNVTVVSPQAALYEVGGMVNEERTANGYKKWKTGSASSPLLFLYALNNYWHTNFKADQEGLIQFDIYFRFKAGIFDPKAAEQFGVECLEPPLLILPRQ